METALFGLFGLSAVVSIWQFAQQPTSLPLDQVKSADVQCVAHEIES